MREVIDSVRRVTGKTITVEECPQRPGDPAVLVASSEKIKAELGWTPKFADLDTILQAPGSGISSDTRESWVLCPAGLLRRSVLDREHVSPAIAAAGEDLCGR